MCVHVLYDAGNPKPVLSETERDGKIIAIITTLLKLI